MPTNATPRVLLSNKSVGRRSNRLNLRPGECRRNGQDLRHMSDRRELAILTGSHAVDDFYQGTIPALVALLVTTRSYGYAAASGITLAASLLSSVVQPVFGAVTDRRELRWLVPLGMA